MSIVSARSAWEALAGRIHLLDEACRSLYSSMASFSSDSDVITKQILPEVGECVLLIGNYRKDFNGQLPIRARERIDTFLQDAAGVLSRKFSSGGRSHRLQELRPRMAALQLLAAGISHDLFDPVGNLEQVSARAFLHLQRGIAVDIGFRTRWREAYADSELAVEQLGALHLLWHGIWAFKVHATGGRTDLVLGNVMDDPTVVRDAGCGLVLTEWKIAKSGRESDQRFREAMAQSQQYSAGILGGLELSSVRYLVVVTDRQVQVPQDQDSSGVTFRHVNIATNPVVPSKVSREIA
jgi:hypothetical protein